MIPTWLWEKLGAPPAAGAGVHAWLFACARQLHAHLAEAEMIAVLQEATQRVERPVSLREIRDAVRNSHSIAWRPTSDLPPAETSPRAASENLTFEPLTAPRWPRMDQVARRCRLADAAAEGVATLHDLWEYSPIRPDDWTADDWLDWLFPAAEWLCLAEDHPATARSRRSERWTFGPAERCGLIVPSPMTGSSGLGLDGRTSHRCLGNTGPRRWLVLEFDHGTIDEQAALHWHLRAAARAAGWPPLRLCVHSGGKSLHGWFGPCPDFGGEDRARELMAYAISLGADPATWNRCQLVRLPGGQRSPGIRQEVFFFAPAWAEAEEWRRLFLEPPRNSVVAHRATSPPEGKILPRSAQGIFEGGSRKSRHHCNSPAEVSR